MAALISAVGPSRYSIQRSRRGVNSAKQIKKRKFTPWSPNMDPAPGTYDPSLSAQLRAANRGYADYTADYTRDYGVPGTPGGRAAHDYQVAVQNTAQQQGRETADYGTATGNLVRNYGILGHNQLQSANAAGLLGGGYLAQALAKRTANQAREQSVLDTAHTRATQDFDTSRAKLGLGYTRATADAATGLARAGRENTNFGQDIRQAEWYESAGQFTPTDKPGNEQKVAGQTYRTLGPNRFLLPSGLVVHRNQLNRRIRRRAGKLPNYFGATGVPSYG